MEVVTKIWTGQKLKKEICCDTETTMAPFHTFDHKLVLFQATDIDGIVYLVRNEDVRRFFNRHHYATFIWHNAVFDLDVLIPFLGQERIFELIDEGRIMCTKLLYILYKLAITGVAEQRVSLKGLVKEFYNVDLEKGQERITFGQYLGKPIEDISENHIKYAALDVIYTFRVYCDLMARIKPLDKMNTLLSYQIQIKGDYALNRIYKNGIGFDLPRKDAWMKDTTKRLFDLQEVLSTYGWVRGAPGVNDRLAGIFEHIGIADKLPKTANGGLSKSTRDLERFQSKPFVGKYLEFSKTEKLSQFLRNLNEDVIHGRFTSILNTGRVSMSAPNLMQIPREGGLRECFIPKNKDNVFFIADYSGMENAMLAQVLVSKYGKSRMADVLNEGLDIHKYYASVMFSKDIELVSKKERQQAKAAVFGFPGGLGIETFKTFAEGYGLNLSDSECQQMKEKYFEAFPEMRTYLRDCNEGDVTTLTGRIRANASYCAVANTPFQGLGSDMAKTAMYDLMKENYHISLFVHDEYIAEEKEDKHRFDKMCKIMINAGKHIAPDLKIDVEGEMVPKWVKL